MKKKSAKEHLLKLTKETPEARRKRVSGGVRFRPVVFADKKKRELMRKPGHERPEEPEE